MINVRAWVVAACLSAASLCANAEDFEAWRLGLESEARDIGLSPLTIQTTLDHIVLLPDVIKLDRAQPEFISTFLDYYSKRVNAKKISRGQELMFAYAPLLDDLEAQYGIPRALLIAFWGMETNYGSFKGNIDTFSTLATLAYDGRRASFFRNQLLDAMRLAEDGHVEVGALHGSWAGAFGHMQFMPSTMLTYALDGDGDKRIDLTDSIPDALTSAANYLSQVGWRANEPAMIEVQLPNQFPWQDANLKITKPVKAWQKLGVKTVSDQVAVDSIKISPEHEFNKFPVVEGSAAILLPQGWRGPAFMVFDNFDVIMDWNRSVNYALSVAQLANELEGGQPILGGQFAEATSLALVQMQELQTALNTLGFNAGVADGFPGLQTQAALRDYQIKHNLPADGFANLSMYTHVMQLVGDKTTVNSNPLADINKLDIDSE